MTMSEFLTNYTTCTSTNKIKTVYISHFRALTLASTEIRFHIDSETHDPIDVQTKEIRYVMFQRK